VRCLEVDIRPDRGDLPLIVALVFDVVHHDGLADAGCLVDVPKVRPKMVVLVEILSVALERCVIALVEADQRREHAHVGQRQAVAGEVALVGEYGVPVVECVEDVIDCVVVGGL
jgi:hypothetical protein